MEECFARNKNRTCKALSKMYCLKEDCSFFKTREHLNNERNKTDERFRKLDATVRMYLIEKYKLMDGK